MMELEVFSGGDVALAQGSVLFRKNTQRFHGFRCDDATGKFDTNHLDIGLALTVDTLLQTEGCEFRVF